MMLGKKLSGESSSDSKITVYIHGSKEDREVFKDDSIVFTEIDCDHNEVDYEIMVIDRITKTFIDLVMDRLNTNPEMIIYASPVLGEMGKTSEPIERIKDIEKVLFFENPSNIINYIKAEEEDVNRFAIYHNVPKESKNTLDEPWMKRALKLKSNNIQISLIGRMDGIYYNYDYYYKSSNKPLDTDSIRISSDTTCFYRGDEKVVVSKSVYDNMPIMMKINNRLTDAHNLLDTLISEFE